MFSLTNLITILSPLELSNTNALQTTFMES
jgi:hypothetical protein